MKKFKIKRNINDIEIYFCSIKIIKFSKNSYIKLFLKQIYSVLLLIKDKFKTIFLPLKRYKQLNDYVSYITLKNNKENFIPIIKDQSIKRNLFKLIAFYLPQYHQIPLNNKYHGQGFTDWQNVAKSIPHWTEHYQPHIPIDVGFYDLNNIDTLKRQVELAKMYGIYGFCFHYYWFSGTKLLEKPINNLLLHKEIEMPFCICWANENWSTLWDGGNRQVIMKQELLDNDAEKFFNDLLPFINDKRYIKIGNKPIIIIYRPDLFLKEKFLEFTTKIRSLAKQNDFDDLFVITAKFKFNDTLKNWNLDAMVEFPPHQMINLKEDKIDSYINPKFIGLIYDMQDYILNEKYIYQSKGILFKTVFPSWDNSARKAYSGAAVYNKMSPDLYKKWLTDCINWTKNNHKKEEQFVFINAWNEWAEGAHLEPDLKYGYSYLQATLESLTNKN